MLWAAMVVAAGVMATRWVAGPPLPPLTAIGLSEAIQTVGTGSPATAVVIGVAATLVGSLGLARPLQAVARSAAVQAAFGAALPWRTAWSSARRLGWQGMGSVLLFTAGIEAFLVTLFRIAIVLGWQDGAFGPPDSLLGGVSVAFLVLGALGLGTVAVEGMAGTGVPAGALAMYSRNGLETLASALAAVLGGAYRFVLVAGLVGLTWLLLCNSLAWSGGDRTGWVRWGLDGRLLPESEPGVYRVASVLAGGWFLFLVGLVLAYPFSNLLGWGVNAYLRARQQSQETPPGQVDLTPEEQVAVRAGTEGRRKWLADLKARAAQRAGQPAELAEGPAPPVRESGRPTNGGEPPPE
jgi:hypothetical protein